MVKKSPVLYIHKQQTNLIVNEAANDSAWIRLQDLEDSARSQA